MKLFSSNDLVRGDHYQACCDHLFWNNARPVAEHHFQAGGIVFCKIDEVLRFFEQLRLTRKRVILVTGEGDFPCDAFRQQFLPANVVHWFSTNVIHPHPRVSALPLGLGAPQDAVTLQPSALHAAQEKFSEKNQWLYVAFRPETNHDIRQKIYDDFQMRSNHEKWITFEAPSSLLHNENFLTQLMRHHFVLCPPGNGVDTHRLWETLAAGAYPIVLRSPAMKPFEALPILFVADFKEVTLDFLKANLQQLEEKKKNLFMIQMPFWQKKIAAAKVTLQGREMMGWGQWLHESINYGVKMIRRRLF